MFPDHQNDVVNTLYALRRNFFLILGVSIVISILAYGIAKKVPGVYEVHFSYMVSMELQDTPSAFRYDGFYALSAADLFSATLASIAISPETIVAMFHRAGISLPTQDATDLGRIVRSKKEASQFVHLTVRDSSKNNAEKLTTALISVMNERIEEYSKKGLSSISFQVIPTQSWTSYSAIKPLPVASSLFMLVFVGGQIVVLFREAIRRGAT